MKLVKVPKISPTLYIEVEDSISKKDLDAKFKRIIDANKKEVDSIKFKGSYRTKDKYSHYNKSYTGTIYSLTELTKNN